MKTQSRYFIYWFMFLWVSSAGFAQESTYSKTYQFSFVPPVSSNGPLSGETSNKVSLNLLAGYAHGVEAFELGGLYNIVRANVRVAQISGFGNTVGGEVHGFQLAGFLNTIKGYVEGAQIAGFINLTGDKVKGFQLGGFTNISKETEGWQIAGFNNHTKASKGVQLAGFMNTTGTLEGLQWAGFINVAKKVKGVQFGVVNIADSVDSGVQFGLVNVSKNGFISPGMETDDVVPYRLVFRSGREQFYTVLTAGAKESEYWSYGAGFGSRLYLSERRNLFVNPELRYHQINKGKSVAENHLVKLNVNFGYQLFKHLYITSGPTVNFYTTNRLDRNGRPLIDIANNPSHDSQSGRRSYQVWVGYSIGIGF
ncbi:MAG: hypothetical protein ABJP45_00625 [Cyclobacteriaceae bacterium]